MEKECAHYQPPFVFVFETKTAVNVVESSESGRSSSVEIDAFVISFRVGPTLL